LAGLYNFFAVVVGKKTISKTKIGKRFKIGNRIEERR
jgi:hypothetical protein